MKMFMEKSSPLKKSYEVALKYGLRGYSRGGKNGIFYLRKSDQGLSKSINSLVNTRAEIIQEDLDIPKKGLDALSHVKITCHNSSGNRVVGVYNQENHRMIFLDYAHY